MNRVEGWMLKVFEQKKTENAVIMNCGMSGKKKEDGTYGKSMYIGVVLNAETDWVHDDLSGKLIDVNGNFALGEYTKEDGTVIPKYTIFADKIAEHVWEEKEKPKKDEKKPVSKW